LGKINQKIMAEDHIPLLNNSKSAPRVCDANDTIRVQDGLIISMIQGLTERPAPMHMVIMMPMTIKIVFFGFS
jgi:hypothetical protein